MQTVIHAGVRCTGLQMTWVPDPPRACGRGFYGGAQRFLLFL